MKNSLFSFLMTIEMGIFHEFLTSETQKREILFVYSLRSTKINEKKNNDAI